MEYLWGFKDEYYFVSPRTPIVVSTLMEMIVVNGDDGNPPAYENNELVTEDISKIP